eukprot:Hpha_TRINITY_DN12399_c0_g1::TRINITY_DN12399_c0_g1_i1::g.155775::m.155775
MTAGVSDLSGVTWNPSTSTLFTVNNGDRIAYEITYPNTEVRQYDLKSLTLDLEGISALGGREFAFTDENPAKILKATFNADGTITGSSTLSSGISPAAGANLGFEGVALLKGANKYIAVQEASPPKLWQLGTASGSTIAALSGDLRQHSQFQIRSVGGLTRGGDATDEVFIVVKAYNGTGRGGGSYIQKAIMRYNLTDGRVTERFGGEVCNMGQPEGLTFWKNATTGKIMMLIVGETYQARVYEADPACTDKIGDIGVLMQTCLEKKQTTAGCEKTRADGGCGWTRCDKSITPNTKVCVDDNPGVTDCSEDQCEAHCVSSNFTGEEKGLTCTHWAYDVAEKECYIFSGCKNDKFDLDYTTYALQDPTCERTRANYPLGCEKRRCDKDISKHNKICTDANPGVTDCTLDQCEANCRGHTDFACSTYAYDVAEKECYLFETCEGEKFDADYSTYVLVDPTCDKNRAQGGCNQRRCDKDLTPHEKICVDDSPDTQCTIDQCEMHCAEKTFSSEHSEAFCTHWAYDAVDKECYLFYGCTDEKYDDDYVLFTQSYGERQTLINNRPSAPTAGGLPPVAGVFAPLESPASRAVARGIFAAILAGLLVVL